MVILLRWWYGQGWLWVGHVIEHKIAAIGRVFAVKVLIRTWFSPWKQLSSQADFHNFLSATLDNTVSRAVGGFVRTLMLFTAFLWALVVLVVGLALLIIWPVIPLGIIIFPILMASEVTL